MESTTQLHAGSRLLPAALFATGFVLLYASQSLADEAQSGAHGIEQIIVVANKDERSIRHIAANVTALSRADIETELAISINDIFRYVPGVDHEGAGTRFGTDGINIRGIGGNRVAILVDGVPFSDQFSLGSYSNATRDFLDAGLIQNIEVLHGPASALYGSAAIGGVVAVRTPDPRDLTGDRRSGANALLTWRGEDSSANGQAMVAFAGSSTGLLIGASWRSGEESESAAAGNDVDTRDYDRRTGLVKLVADDPWGNSLTASLIHQSSHTLSDTNSLLGTGRFASTTALAGDDRHDMDVANFSYRFSGPGRTTADGVLRVYYQATSIGQYTLDERGNAATPVSIDRFFDFEQDARGLELNLWADRVGANVTHRLGFGIEYRDRDTREYRDGLQTGLTDGAVTNNLLGEEFPLRDFPISTVTEVAAFVEDTVVVGAWTVIAALRADRFALRPRLDSMYAEDNPSVDPVSIDASDLSPKLGVIYKALPDLDLYLQYAHGFRAPPYSDANIGLDIALFNVRAIPNPDLRSESSDGVEFGVRFLRPAAGAHLAVFHTRYADFIESKVRLGVDPVSGRMLFQSQNLRATTVKGVEGAASLRFGGASRALGLDVAAFYARGRNTDNGQALNSVGPAQAVLGLSWNSQDDRRQLRLKTTLTEAWSARDESAGALFKPSGHGVVDLFATQQLGRGAVLRAGLHNLTDRVYWYWADVRGLPQDDPMLPYLARAGRSASVSLNLSW